MPQKGRGSQRLWGTAECYRTEAGSPYSDLSPNPQTALCPFQVEWSAELSPRVWVNQGEGGAPPPPLQPPKTVAHPSVSHIGWRLTPWARHSIGFLWDKGDERLCRLKRFSALFAALVFLATFRTLCCPL